MLARLVHIAAVKNPARKPTRDRGIRYCVPRTRYDGTGRRIQKTAKGAPDVTFDYYYSGRQVVEVRKGGSVNPYEQYVWGVRYVHSPVLRWWDENTDGQDIETHYYTNDANFNVTALVETDGDVIERYVYDPYGQRTIYDDDWSETVDWEDSKKNEILFTGHRLDTETGLYYGGWRYYHPTLGLWVSRDLLGYVDGMSLYENVKSNPVMYVDFLGSIATLSREVCLDIARNWWTFWSNAQELYEYMQEHRQQFVEEKRRLGEERQELQRKEGRLQRRLKTAEREWKWTSVGTAYCTRRTVTAVNQFTRTALTLPIETGWPVIDTPLLAYGVYSGMMSYGDYIFYRRSASEFAGPITSQAYLTLMLARTRLEKHGERMREHKRRMEEHQRNWDEMHNRYMGYVDDADAKQREWCKGCCYMHFEDEIEACKFQPCRRDCISGVFGKYGAVE